RASCSQKLDLAAASNKSPCAVAAVDRQESAARSLWKPSSKTDALAPLHFCGYAAPRLVGSKPPPRTRSLSALSRRYALPMLSPLPSVSACCRGGGPSSQPTHPWSALC